MNETEIEGIAKDAIGKVKDGVGGLTGDTSLQIEGKMDQATGKLQGKIGEIKDQLDGAADAFADRACEFAGQAGSALRDAAQSGRRSAGQAGEKIYDASVHAGQYAGRTVQEQPLLTLIGVAAIGYLIGFLIHSPVSPLTPKPRSGRYFR
jgi:uncharacterized protein YjbJ (UPF0337 family)